MLNLLPATYYLLPIRRHGQTALSLVFLIGGIIVLAGVAMASLTNSFLNSTYGFGIAERARAVAVSGIYDALMRLARDKGLSSAGYALSVGGDSTTVSVTQDSPSAGLVKVVSTATISNRQRRITAVVSRDVNLGQASVVSWDQNR